MTTMYRQGDVLIVRMDTEPVLGEKVPRDNGRVILAYGEVTGHAHALTSKDVSLFLTPDATHEGDEAWRNAQRFLVVKRPSLLTHEEHSQIRLPAGNYRVVIQREYSPEAIRNVLD